MTQQQWNQIRHQFGCVERQSQSQSLDFMGQFLDGYKAGMLYCCAVMLGKDPEEFDRWDVMGDENAEVPNVQEVSVG